VIDVGEGSGSPPDSVTQVFLLPPWTLTCRDIEPTEVGPVAAPIVAGNVQVR